MMSTAGANLSVGPPYDGCVYLEGSFEPIEFRIESDSPLLEKLQEAWAAQMQAAVDEVSRISHEDPTISIPPPRLRRLSRAALRAWRRRR